MVWNKSINIATSGKGLYPITENVLSAFESALPENGLLNLFIQHTSASLVIQENADPTAREDLEQFLDQLAPDHQKWHRHTLEGPDDTTSHMKSVLTNVSLNIPIINHQLALGTWQGLFLWEHRTASQRRKVVLTLYS